MNTYTLLDSGDGSKLEVIGSSTIVRPSIHSFYAKSSKSIWKDADAVYIKNETGSGAWTFHNSVPEEMKIRYEGFDLLVKLTPFGHIGFFPEQAKNWKLIKAIGKNTSGLEVLNMFAYSGVSTLACLQAGMSVCHLDSSRGMVEWAKQNAKLSGLSEKPVRWIAEDVLKFVKREVSRGKKYHGFILDPPTFGRGSKGEVWKIEKHLKELIDTLLILCDHAPKFVILSCHSTGFSPLTLERVLRTSINGAGKFSSTELYTEEQSGNFLPGGFCAYYLSETIKV